MACVVVLSLMRTLELEFLQPHPRPILQQNELTSCIKLLGQLAQSLHKKLGCLMELFDENRMDGVEAIKDLETKLRDVAFHIEDEIELQVVHLYGEKEEGEEEEEEDEEVGTVDPATGKSHPCLQFRRILHRAEEEIDAIEEELVKAKMEYNHFIALQGRKTISLDATPKFDDQLVKMDSSCKNDASHSEDIMVGKKNEFETIRKMLIEHTSQQLEVVSIQGMGGIGKTTLARRVYEDPSISSHFDKREWVVASQHHNKRQMLLGLLNSKDNANNRSDEDLALQLYQSLKCQRYLVVIDDIWSTNAWNDVKSCFPNDSIGSRVLLTTRLAEVATHTTSNNDFSHQMHFLDQSESWDLFYEKACKSMGAEFETIGRPVVDKCKGLPLAIIVVAGLFSKLNTLDEWKNTANALSYSSTTTTLDDEECSRILSLSYNHLPHNLKACFLYLGVFPEDEEIYASYLARLWFAEGLVKAREYESFDAVANRYIQELMDRNLIILNQLSSSGRKIRRFRMHDLLHAFCVREAQNENLLHVVVSENSFDFPQNGFRWLSIQSGNFKMSKIGSRSKSLRSLFEFVRVHSCFDFINLNLLRVLCGHPLFKSEIFKNIVYNVHLRFLRSSGNKELSRAKGFVKSRCSDNIELSRAWNLQTLSGGRASYYRSDDGVNSTEFPQLQYIRCSGFHGNIPKFVRDFSMLRADNCSKEYIMNIPDLEKVSIEGERRDCNDCITNLAYLEQLERLFIMGDGDDTQTPINNHIVLLKNLRKLSIWHMGFEWKEINVLSQLHRLEVLKLDWNTCVGEEWEIPEEVIFCNLIYLYIDSPGNLKHWKASSHNFPKLERLKLCRCYNLREIPKDFEDIPTLKSIELEFCLPSAVMSAKQIQEGQRDYGNENMTVIEYDTIEPDESDKFELEICQRSRGTRA